MNPENIEKIKNTFPEILEKESLKNHAMMRVGGKARLYYIAKKSDDLIKIIKMAQKLNMPYLVIGNASNVVFADADFDCLVVRNETGRMVFEQNQVIADSGISLPRLIRKLAESDLGSLEFLAGIPGTLGGAIYGNAGAYGRNIGDITRSVVILDTDGEIKKVSQEEMNFGYRTSALKKVAAGQDVFRRPIIISARLQVSHSTKEGVLRVVNNYVNMRVGKYPNKPSCGSFFKNIIVEDDRGLGKEVKLMVIEGKIPAGMLIEKTGLKGLKEGGAKLSELHANFLINNFHASARDVKKLCEKVQEKVSEKWGIKLKPEVEFIGNFEQEPEGFWRKIFKKPISRRGKV